MLRDSSRAPLLVLVLALALGLAPGCAADEVPGEAATPDAPSRLEGLRVLGGASSLDLPPICAPTEATGCIQAAFSDNALTLELRADADHVRIGYNRPLKQLLVNGLPVPCGPGCGHVVIDPRRAASCRGFRTSGSARPWPSRRSPGRA